MLPIFEGKKSSQTKNMAVTEYVWGFGSDISLEPVSDLVGCIVVVKKRHNL